MALSLSFCCIHVFPCHLARIQGPLSSTDSTTAVGRKAEPLRLSGLRSYFVFEPLDTLHLCSTRYTFLAGKNVNRKSSQVLAGCQAGFLLNEL